MEALDQLGAKVELLLKKQAALHAENERLKATIASQEKTAEVLQRKLDSLEQGMVSVHMAKAVISGEDQDNMLRQLDNVIDEIDRILNTLND